MFHHILLRKMRLWELTLTACGEMMGLTQGPTNHRTKEMESAIFDGPNYQAWVQSHASNPLIRELILKKKTWISSPTIESI